MHEIKECDTNFSKYMGSKSVKQISADVSMGSKTMSKITANVWDQTAYQQLHKIYGMKQHVKTYKCMGWRSVTQITANVLRQSACQKQQQMNGTKQRVANLFCAANSVTYLIQQIYEIKAWRPFACNYFKKYTAWTVDERSLLIAQLWKYRDCGSCLK